MRIVASILAGLFAAGALALALTGLWPVAGWLGWLAALVIAGLLVERWRYKRLGAAPPGPGWERTGERFVDPETGRLVTVWFHPATGERRYVAR